MRDVVLKPTVVIGLGGSGYETVLNLKMRVVEAFGRVPPTLAFLAFDTTQNPNAVRRTSRGEEVALTPGEFVRIVVDNPHRFIQTNPSIKAWFPAGLDTQAIIAGAGMVRARGRLAFFFRFKQYRQAIHDAKNRVRLLEHDGTGLASGITTAEGGDVNVYVCSSICGGTGSGAFIDVAWLAREGLGTSSQVNGVLFLPRIFKANVTPSHLMLKNAYSALKELDHWMSGRAPGTIDYGSTRLTPTRLPFDLTYLVDGINRNNKVITDLPQLYDFAAEAIFLMIGSQVGQAGDNTLDNVVIDLAGRPTVKGKKAVYCSFGVGRLTYPARQATELAVARHAVRLGREELLDGLTSETHLEADVRAFTVKTGLLEDGADAVLERLIRLPEGGLFAVAINLADVDADRAAPTNARQYGEHRQNASTSELQRHLERNYQELLGRTLISIDQYFADLLDTRANGLAHARSVANKLHARLETWRQRLAAETGEWTTRLDRVNVTGALAAVEQASKRMVLSQRHLRAVIAEYAVTLTTECQLRLEVERRSRAAQLFARLSESLKELMHKLDTVTAVCRAVVDDLEHRFDRAQGNRSDAAFERRIAGSGLSAGLIAVSAVEFLTRKSGRMLDWTFKDRERVANELWAYVSEQAQKVVTPRLEQVTTPAVLAQQLQELNGISTPLWQYDRAELPPQAADTVTFYIYGVENKEQTLLRRPEITDQLPAGQGKPTIVGTNDPETIYQLQIEAGLPLFALRDLPQWKEEYDDPERHTGHVMEGAKQFPELLSDIGTSKALRVFALAVSDVFKIIQQETTGLANATVRYAIARKRGLREEQIQLGEGRVAAFRAFAADEQLVQDVAAQLQRREAAMTRDDLLAQLQTYYRALEDKRQNAQWPFQIRVHVEQELDTLNEYVDELMSASLRV